MSRSATPAPVPVPFPVPPPAGAVTGALRATYLAFFAAGFSFASWASRIPRVRDLLGLSAGELGWVLLASAVGSLVALPLSGLIVNRWGSRRTVAASAVLLAVAEVVIAGGSASRVLGVAAVVVGLLLFGFASGAWDVAMNVQGAQVERHLGRSVMPRLHAGFSLGMVGGALTGAAMVALGVPVPVHLSLVALLSVQVVPRSVAAFLPEDGGGDRAAGTSSPSDGGPARTFWTAWREPRTLMVGFVVLAFAFAEGVGNDWIGVSLIDGYDTAPAAGALGFAAFVAAMTTGRWFGPGLLDRYGRVVVVRGTLALSLAGIALFITSPSVPVAFVGLLLWGLGASLGFPVGMSAAADEPEHAASRVSVAASIGYCAFLAGPPVIGMLGEHVTVLRALAALGVPLLLAVLVVPALRPPHGDDPAGRAT